MQQHFLNNKQSLAAKELGFDEPCFAKYNKGNFQLNSLGSPNNYNDGSFGVNLISAPLKSQFFKWVRKKYGLHGCIDLHVSKPTHWYFRIDDIEKNDYIYHSEDSNTFFDIYEQAEDACIDKIIEILKNKQL